MSALLKHEVSSILSSVRRRPLVPLVAAGMIALSFAANVAVFTVISRTLLRPLPFDSADRLLAVVSMFVGPDHKEEAYPSSTVDIVQWQQRSSRFSSIEAIRPVPMTVRDTGDAQNVAGANVTGGLFRLFRVHPILGRDFVREDDIPNATVAIISHGLWQRRFGGSAKVIGRSLLIDARSVSIIGVLPSSFEIAGTTPQPDVFIPLGIGPANMPVPGGRSYTVFGRLRDGVSPTEAELELRGISDQVAREFRASNEHWTARVKTLRDAAFGDRRRALLTLWLTVVLVHVLACVNVASLLSAQIADERGMTALRLVLGAHKKNILRYRIIESLLTTGAGAMAGFLLGSVILHFVLLSATDGTLSAPAENAWIMPVFLIALSVVSGVLVAIVPALRETGTKLTGALNEQGNRAFSTVRGTRLRELFIIGEVALAVPLLLVAMAAVQHFRELRRVSIGFDPNHVLVSQIVLPPRYYKPHRTAFARELVRRIETVPGVSAAAVTTCNFAPNSAVTTIASTDRFPEPISMNFRRVTPAYFTSMRIPLVAGRAFSDADTLDSPPVMIISVSLAKQFFPGENPIGQRIRRTGPNPPATVVGIAPDVRDDGANVESRPTLYASYLQNNNIFMTLVVRAHGDPLSVRDGVRRAVWSLDRDITPSSEAPLSSVMLAALSGDRLQMILLGGFGGVALILAVVGIYGMTSYVVARRMREIGVRLAFGATPRAVVKEVVVRTARLVLMGLAVGFGLTVVVQRVASLMVYGVPRLDVVTAAFVMILLFGTALLAACLPSMRARRVHPALLLRDA